MSRDLPFAHPGERHSGERLNFLAEERREGWAGFGAAAVVLGMAIGSWLVLSAPQSASSLAVTVVPAADAATLFGTQQESVSAAKRIILTAADETAKLLLTVDDVIKIQNRLKALGFNPGNPDGKAGPNTIKALNEYRKSLGLQPISAIDRPAVAPLLP
jgi:Putative peptidoglycan binding domain